MDIHPREFYFQWHLTDRCNLFCKHCYENNRLTSELILPDKERVIDIIIQALRKWHMSGRVSLTGGEPFLLNDFFPLLESLNNRKEIVKLNILTNGTLITPTIAQDLKKIKKINEIQVSLDGACEEIHDGIRGKGNYSKALEGIDYLVAHGINVSIMFTLWKHNMNDIPALIDLVIAKGVSALTVERMVPCGSGKQLKSSMLSPTELKNVYHYLNERTSASDFINSGCRLRRSRPLWINTCINAEEGQAKGIGGFCPVGFTSMAILPDSTVLPCRRLEIPIGNILKDGLYKIWYTSELLWRVRNKNNLSGKCNGCKNVPYCGGCRAIAYYLTGDYMGEDVQCWI